jgi:transposase
MQVARHALEVYGIALRYVHLDSSSFHVHGDYEGIGEETQVIRITQGYSKEHRPDLKQVVLNLMTAQESALPIWLEALSGNSNDKKSFPETVRMYFEQWQTEDPPYVIMDSAGYSQKTIETMGVHGWLMRVPETLALAQQLVRETQQADMTELQAGYWGRETVCEYARVKQRWLVVFSEIGYQRELKTLEKKQAKEFGKAEVAWRKICRQVFNCTEDAQQAQLTFDQRWKFHQTQAEILPVRQYPQPGRPAAGAQPDVIGYQLKGEVIADEQELVAFRARLGKFIVATNQMDVDRLSVQEMLRYYTAQGISVERGFRFLKDPLFFAHSLFLKSPGRIMALLMIMGLSLLIYALAERNLRQRLAETCQSVPDQKRKLTQRPTMRWVFQLFEGIDILIIRQGEQVLNRQVLNLREEHLTIIRLLGPPVENCYLSPA